MCTWINVMQSFCYMVWILLFHSHVYCYFVMMFCQFVMLLVVLTDKNSSFFNVGKPLPDMVLTFIVMRFTLTINFFITYRCSHLTPYSYIIYVYVSLWFWFVIFHDVMIKLLWSGKTLHRFGEKKQILFLHLLLYLRLNTL